jgi:hypothetical protein
MARNVRLRWQLPSTRIDGSPLAVSDIAEVRLGVKVDGDPGPYAVLGSAPPSQLELLVPELEPGIWHFRAEVVDKQLVPRTSDPAFASADVPLPILAAPSAVISFTATVE